MILKELPLVHSFTHRETFIQLFTQNIDLKPLDWAKLIPDDLHPGRCDSTVILLLSTQIKFQRGSSNHWISARGAGMLFTKIDGEGNKCYSNVWFKESWLLGMNFCNLFSENQIQPFTFFLSFFCLFLVEQMKKIYQELKHKGCTQSWDHRDQNESMKNNRNSATDEAI